MEHKPQFDIIPNSVAHNIIEMDKGVTILPLSGGSYTYYLLSNGTVIAINTIEPAFLFSDRKKAVKYFQNGIRKKVPPHNYKGLECVIIDNSFVFYTSLKNNDKIVKKYGIRHGSDTYSVELPNGEILLKNKWGYQLFKNKEDLDAYNLWSGGLFHALAGFKYNPEDFEQYTNFHINKLCQSIGISYDTLQVEWLYFSKVNDLLLRNVISIEYIVDNMIPLIAYFGDYCNKVLGTKWHFHYDERHKLWDINLLYKNTIIPIYFYISLVLAEDSYYIQKDLISAFIEVESACEQVDKEEQ
ncbi:MAG: hypothetical protein JNM36_13000 [Chitinophagales bacterium]|nr:hypothetical protein [Chitinophagales bacterium]